MEGFLNYFFTQGILGVICIGEFLVIWFLYRESRDLNAKRLEDLKTIQNVLVEPLKRLQDSSDSVIKKMEQNNDVILKLLSKR